MNSVSAYQGNVLIGQLERLEQSVDYLETARRSVDARLADIDEYSVKSQSDITGLKLRLANLAEDFNHANNDFSSVLDEQRKQQASLQNANVRLNQTEFDINQLRLVQLAVSPDLAAVNEKVDRLIAKKSQHVKNDEFDAFKTSIEKVFHDQTADLERQVFINTQVTTLVFSKYTGLKNQMSNITFNLATTTRQASTNADEINALGHSFDVSGKNGVVLTSEPDFLNLQTRVAQFESDLVNYGVESANRDDTMKTVVEHVDSLETSLNGYKQLLAAYQVAVVTKPQVEKAIEGQMKQNQHFSKQIGDLHAQFDNLPEQIRKTVNKQVKDVAAQIDSAEQALNELTNQISSQGEQVSQLEADFVNFEFLIDDEINPQMAMLNESLVTIEETIENTIPTSVHRIEHLLMDEIENKFRKINDNMQKFSDVSSLSANELRSLFESQLLQLHSQMSNQEAKQEAQLIKQKSFNEKAVSNMQSLEEKTKLHEITISDMSSIVTQQTMSIETKVDNFKELAEFILFILLEKNLKFTVSLVEYQTSL